MDIEFLTAWNVESSISSTHNPRPTLYHFLVKILVHTPTLRALRIRVADASGSRSAWTNFSLSRVHGIPLTHAFAAELRRWPQFSLPALRMIELDGFEGVSPLLRLAPNLRIFRMALSAGFSQSSNVGLLQALQHVPKLRELRYSADTLQLPDGLSRSDSNNDDGWTVELLAAIGRMLPWLETLDLQTRWHNKEIYFCSSTEPISAKVCVHL